MLHNKMFRVRGKNLVRVGKPEMHIFFFFFLPSIKNVSFPFQLLTVNVSKIIGVDTVKETLQRLSVNHSVSAIKVSSIMI